jgi:hypothetical protein
MSRSADAETRRILDRYRRLDGATDRGVDLGQ